MYTHYLNYSAWTDYIEYMYKCIYFHCLLEAILMIIHVMSVCANTYCMYHLFVCSHLSKVFTDNFIDEKE